MTCAQGPNYTATVLPELSSDRSSIRHVIDAVMLESELEKLDTTEESVSTVRRRNALETSLRHTLQLLWKDDVTAQQLGGVSDEDSDDGDDVRSFVTASSDSDDDPYDATYDYLYHLYDM